MPSQNVRTHQRMGKDGTKHTVRQHSRTFVGGGKPSGKQSWSLGFEPLTPARASAGALIGGAAYWLFSGAMSLVVLIGFCITAAVAAIMGFDAVKKKVSQRKNSGKRSVTGLRARVRAASARERFKRAWERWVRFWVNWYKKRETK